MPFARLSMPSLALTQLAAVVREQLGDRVEVAVHYLNLDFAAFLDDPALYEHCLSDGALLTGLGEWFFRASAFPEVPDNADAFYARFYPGEEPAQKAFREKVEARRARLDEFLDAMIDQYDLGSMDVVGFATLFSQTVASFALAARLKARFPSVRTLIGGSACEAEMGLEIAEHLPQMDFVFSGPALKNFPQLLEELMEGLPGAGENIQGVMTRGNLERVREEGEGNGLKLLGEDADINDCVPLDYEPFLARLHAAFPGKEVAPVLLFETSRGCWWAERSLCSFCGLNGLQMKHRALTPANAIAHLESLYPYTDRCKIFMGVDTILPKGYTRAVFPQMQPPPDMCMYYELKVDVSKRDLEVLVQAGVRAFQPGIESLSSDTLRLMQKGTNAFRNLMFLKTCSAHPVHVDWNLLVFSPGEPESVFEKVYSEMPALSHLAPPSGAYPISFARFSRYFQDPEAYGLSLKPQDYYGFIFPFDADSVWNLAYHFADRHADTATIDSWLDRLNGGIAHWRQRWLGEDGHPQARLCFAGDASQWGVYDSRSGQEEETVLSPMEKDMLDFLETPRTRSQLQEAFGDDAEQRIDAFCERQWLFEESGRFMSLVT